MQQDTAEEDRVARKILMSVLPLHPETPRRAYEMFKGGPSADDEWAQHGSVWQRNWDECQQLYNTVMKAEQILNQAFEDYQRSDPPPQPITPTPDDMDRVANNIIDVVEKEARSWKPIAILELYVNVLAAALVQFVEKPNRAEWVEEIVRVIQSKLAIAEDRQERGC